MTITGMKTWKLYQHYDGLILYTNKIHEKCPKVALHRWAVLIFINYILTKTFEIDYGILKITATLVQSITHGRCKYTVFSVCFKLSLFGCHILTKIKTAHLCKATFGHFSSMLLVYKIKPS